MNEGVAITFAVIFVVVSLIGLVLFKELRTHAYWRELVEANDVTAIRGLLEAEIEHWHRMRPPKAINATVWAGVQGMELLAADTTHVQITTSAEPEMRVLQGKSQQVATALDIGPRHRRPHHRNGLLRRRQLRPRHRPRRRLHHLP